MLKFPTVTGSNLLKQKLTLPNDFEGNINLVFVPFWQWQQMEVDSWISLVQKLEQENPDLRYYELPTIRRLNIFAQAFINNGMRGGIPDPKTRGRTITLYLDKGAFRKSLEMIDEDHIYVYLVDQEGNIFWSDRGAFTPEKAEMIETMLRAKHPTQKYLGL